MKDKDFKIGDTVYYYDEEIGTLIEAKILDADLSKNQSNLYRRICDCYYCDPDGTRLDKMFGTRHYEKRYLFHTSKEAYDSYVNECDKRYKNCLNEITTVQDLVKFALHHVICGEDADYPATEAYCAKARELLGMDI